MRYNEIFHEIVDILHEDYAGCYDKQGCDNPELYEEKIELLEQQESLTPHIFEELVSDYLLDFQDPHMFFKLKESDDVKRFDIGFKVRRYKDKLYMISADLETRFHAGEAIISLDGVPVKDLVKKHQRELIEKVAEREKWENILKRYSYCVVEDQEGHEREMKIELYEKEDYQPQHTIEKVDNETLLITLTDFFDGAVMKKLIQDHREELERTPKIIIDVRLNLGGSTNAYQDFLSYIFPEGSVDLASLFDYDSMEFHCTERICDLQKEKTDQYLKETEDEDTREWVLNYQKGWEENRGKGFVDMFGTDEPFWIEGKQNPKHIVLLSDVKCGSAGDIFVETAKESPKVTVVGRPTANLNKYSNLINKEWENTFELWYPTSKLVSEKEIEGGQPDIYIPWTPEHLERDVDMEEAKRVLREKVASK